MTPEGNLATADPESRSRPGIRRLGLLGVAIVSIVLCTTLSLRVLFTTLWPDVSPSSRECGAAVELLYVAVERAKAKADLQTNGEQKALQVFREALLPEWSEFESIRKTCATSRIAKAQLALRQVELLRYAEERAVRYEALDLSRLRREAPAAVMAIRSINPPQTTP